ncbi:uncharacterized protein LOC127707647 [Mytilus californianus]|uniref:uncharacterized protein LOC127707647 n=1 Tax=Mytilus californianus TaxID=6549 RepID=UPI0022463A6A|nr:uncharacterized protein LOC127707647 [Mytilus californianus]
MAQCPIGNCEICVQATGSHYCKQCRQYFCYSCKTAHLRLKIARNHVFGKSFEVDVEDVEEQLKCNHVDRHVFMCLDCDFALCKGCLVENHNGHSVDEVDKMFSSLHYQASTTMKGIFSDFKRKSGDMLSMTTSYEKESEKLERAISNQGAKIKSSIDKMVNAIIENVKKSRENVRNHYPMCFQDAISSTFTQWLKQIDEIGQKEATETSIHEIQKLLNDMKAMELPNLPDVPAVSYCAQPVDEKIIMGLLGRIKFLSFSNPNPKSKELLLSPCESGYGFRLIGGKDFNDDIYVSDVVTGGSAAKAGLKQLDKIIAVDGKQVKGSSHHEVAEMFKNVEDNDVVSISIEPFHVSDVSSNTAKAGLKQLDKIITDDGKQVKGSSHHEVAETIKIVEDNDVVSIRTEPFEQ